MSESESNKKRNEKLELYNDILKLVEEEIYQRRNGNSYKDYGDDNRYNVQTGGAHTHVKDMFVPGKFEAVRHSMELPLDVAIRGTVARQKLFAQEHGL